MDPLQLLPVEDWPLLRDSLKRDWPTYACLYNWVINAMKWKQKNPQLKHDIYCPNGKHESGVFVGISCSGLRIVTAFAFNESKDLLKQMLNETKILNWDDGFIFSAIHEYCVDVIEDVLKKKKKKINKTVTNFYFKSKEDCANVETPKIPEECEVKALSLTDIRLIHSIWPHRDLKNPELSTKFLENFIKLNRGVGLFLKKDNSLVSWVLHSDWGGLGMLQTVDEHKRKGYGKIVTQIIIKQLAVEEGLDSILYVVKNNVASEKLFESLGYTRYTEATWYLT